MTTPPFTFLGVDCQTVEAVQFDGSSTSLSAIRQWIETGTYTHPRINTRDIRFSATIDGLEVAAGDWIVHDPTADTLTVVPHALFHEQYLTEQHIT